MLLAAPLSCLIHRETTLTNKKKMYFKQFFLPSAFEGRIRRGKRFSVLIAVSFILILLSPIENEYVKSVKTIDSLEKLVCMFLLYFSLFFAALCDVARGISCVYSFLTLI